MLDVFQCYFMEISKHKSMFAFPLVSLKSKISIIWLKNAVLEIVLHVVMQHKKARKLKLFAVR